MLKRELEFRKITYSILLLFSIFVLAGSVGSANGTVLRTYYPSEHNILNGTYLFGSVPLSVQTVDSDYFIFGSSPSVTSASTYNPSAYNLFGSTAYVSGTTGDLVSDNGIYMTLRSYASATSAQSLYAHQETTTVGGATYYPLKTSSADAAGTTLSADAGTTTGRKIMGKYVYPLTGVFSIPASVWVIYYQVCKDNVKVEAHADIEVLIRMTNDTVRTTIATDVANSGPFTTSWSTISGSYSWAAYTVVNQTDYLEIDYYIEVTAIKSDLVYLRIDDNTLAVADQTRAANVMLPSEFTTELEFTGTSNIYSWAELEWTAESAWTTANVSVTLQLYNYTLGAYPTSGNGYSSYISSATANTDETKTQTIATNPQHFRDATGNWKIKVKGAKSTDTQFDFKANLIEFRSMYYSEYTVSTEFLFSSMKSNTSTQLNFTIVSQSNISSVNVTVQIWNYSSFTYATSGEGYLTYTSNGSNETKTLNINTNPQFYTSNGNAKIKITGVLSTPNQFQQEINQVIIKVSTQTSSQPFDWFTTLMYVLPLVFMPLFLVALKLKRKKATASPKPIQPPEGSLEEPKPKKPHIAKKTDAFSQRFGMTHQQMAGKKMLLEIDPTSDYHKALSSFVSEAKNNEELLFILTNKNSTLHSAFSGEANAKFLLLTSKTSSPQQINEKETLLPASDLSVLLDAFVRNQKVETKEPINVLFDNLSDIILRCGFEKTYKFIGFLLEVISSRKTTVLFVFNPTAHDQVISSSIRGLFHVKLAYANNGPKVGTL